MLVPKYFYKAVFTVRDTVPYVIGFMFDQMADNDQRLENFIVPIDSIERVAGIDFFENMYGDWDTEILLEQQSGRNEKHWPFNERWYQERINNQ